MRTGDSLGLPQYDLGQSKNAPFPHLFFSARNIKGSLFPWGVVERESSLV